MLEINLKGKVAFIADIGDDQGYGWAIAKAPCRVWCNDFSRQLDPDDENISNQFKQ